MKEVAENKLFKIHEFISTKISLWTCVGTMWMSQFCALSSCILEELIKDNRKKHNPPSPTE
jgi:hypothetical protein